MNDFVQQLPGVIYQLTIAPDGKKSFSFISKNCIDIFGVEAEAVMRDASLLEDSIYSEDRLSFELSSHDSFMHGTIWCWEGRIQVNNTIRWIEARSNYCNDNGVVTRKGIILDITDRKTRELQNELRYQTLLEDLPIGVGVHVEGKLVFANRHAHEILGAKANELIGKNVLDLVHPEFKRKINERIKLFMQGQPLPMMEEKLIRLDGRVIDVETGAIPINYKGLKANQIIVRDITDRKQAEAASRRNETLFTQLFNSLPMGVVMLDKNGKVEQVNQGFREMFGYDLDILRGKNLNDFIVPEELRNEGIDLNNLITANKIISVSTKRKHKNGCLIDVLLYGVPVMLDYRTIGIYGVYVDITERKKVEEELMVRNTELDNFVYKVSHDLRAPLSSILGLVNLAKLPGNDDDPMDYINIIGNKVASLDNFISDVLSHSKNLKLDVTTARVDFQKIINQAFADLNYLEGASEIKVFTRVERKDYFSDPWRISEVIRNLVSNSIKYRQLLGAQPEINIEIDAGVNHIRMVFSDNGIGIEKDNLSRIFNMFYRATEQASGSGIGLYIVKNAIDKLGGTISVHSEVGQGTTFTIVLPNQSAEVKSAKAYPSVLQ